jgi:glycine cleavage system H protein
MNIPDNLYYTKDHEWTKISNDEVTVGVTDYAQSELGDIVYLELPEVGSKVSQGESFGTIEAVKAVSDLFAPISGEIIAVNNKLSDSPEVINSDPYGEGWMIKIKLENPDEVNELLPSTDYQKLIES